ncbi:hypothetical protein [Daejeonella sp. H1SJ63]|jgi:hypothetical protein|uniref:hypothetical protein n=1 Tax=Daejeonella sp. H1SJ63 TaxID=3034145 RepID=UPI0023EBC148|nr:hypothetical protein [Daejeonella sp. H1SJ63]
MNPLFICRTIFMLALTGIFPALLYAGDGKIYERPQNDLIFKEGIYVLIDTIPVRRGGSEKTDQEQPRDDRRGLDDIRTGNQRPGGENHRLGPRSGIKQVPRSIPKIKPQAVTDRIPIRRLPIKIPRKGFGGFHIQ